MTSNATATLLLTHLGLGDQIICNAVIRAAVAAFGAVTLPVKASNVESISFMLRDLDGLTVMEVPDSFHRNGGEKGLLDIARKWNGCVQNLTMFDRSSKDDRWVSDEETCFDTNFFRWAGLSIEEKFSGFRCDRDISIEIPVPDGPYVLMHDDDNFPIVRGSVTNSGLPVHHVHDFRIGNIFALWGIIENAAEIHMINSGPLNLTDFLEPKGRLFWHKYSRDEVSYPTLRHDWKILD